MLRQHSSARNMRSSAARKSVALGCIIAAILGLPAMRADAARDTLAGDIRLELSPRICTLAADDKQCEARVHAMWRSAREESLCLVIVDHPQVKRCWEHFSNGTYTIELVFSEDLIFQLKDPDLQRVLTSETLRVIREAIRYRHRRRQPWNIFD